MHTVERMERPGLGGRKERTMTMQVSGGLDFEILRRAIEERDADTPAGLYAEDAEIHAVNRSPPPALPACSRGRERSPSTCETSAVVR
jgi:hypothetical protein